MKKYSCASAMYMSFYSAELYRDVAKNWGAGVVLYLFILLAICWSVLVVKLQPEINTVFIRLANNMSTQIPPFAINKGIVKTPENRPYEIIDPKTKETFAIIDTSGRYDRLCIAMDCQESSSKKSAPPSSTRILVTQDRVFYADNSDTIKIQALPKSLTMAIEPKLIQKEVVKFVGWSWVILFPILLIFSFAYRLVEALVYAILGKIFAAFGHIPLTYSEVLKITMIAMTPAILLATIFDWFNIVFHLQWFLYFIITMIYLLFGLNVNKKPAP